MDWHSVLEIVGIILFVVIMMRGCGGMMAGGCGMGGCGMGSRSKRPAHEQEDKKPPPEAPTDIRR